jgi:hypothetical protein
VTVAWGGWKSPVLFYTLSGDTSGGGFAIDAVTGEIRCSTAAESTSRRARAFLYGHRDGARCRADQHADLHHQGGGRRAGTDDLSAGRPRRRACRRWQRGRHRVHGERIRNGPVAVYELTDDANGRFTIDPNTGEVTVANGAAIDYETAPGHIYTITAKGTVGDLSHVADVHDQRQQRERRRRAW